MPKTIWANQLSCVVSQSKSLLLTIFHNYCVQLFTGKHVLLPHSWMPSKFCVVFIIFLLQKPEWATATLPQLHVGESHRYNQHCESWVNTHHCWVTCTHTHTVQEAVFVISSTSKKLMTSEDVTYKSVTPSHNLPHMFSKYQNYCPAHAEKLKSEQLSEDFKPGAELMGDNKKPCPPAHCIAHIKVDHP